MREKNPLLLKPQTQDFQPNSRLDLGIIQKNPKKPKRVFKVHRPQQRRTKHLATHHEVTYLWLIATELKNRVNPLLNKAGLTKQKSHVSFYPARYHRLLQDRFCTSHTATPIRLWEIIRISYFFTCLYCKCTLDELKCKA